LSGRLGDAGGRGRNRLFAGIGIVVAVVMAVSLVAVLSRVGEPGAPGSATWRSGAVPAGQVAHVYGPAFTTGGSGNCDQVFGRPVSAGGRVFVAEQTCALSGGYSEPGREHRTSDRPAYVLHELRADGTVRQGPVNGFGDWFLGLLAAAPDGTLYAWAYRDLADGGRVIARSPNGEWRAVTAARGYPSGHSGDGGPAAEATVGEIGAAAVGPDGALYLAEPFAVRRIGLDGAITTIAGTDAEDPAQRSGAWGGRGHTGDTHPPVPVAAGPAPARSTPLPFIEAMTVDADGTVWLMRGGEIFEIRDGIFRLAFSSTVGDMTPGGRLVEAPHAGSSATTSPDGRTVYFFEEGTGRLLAVDTRRRTLGLLAGQPWTGQRPGADAYTRFVDGSSVAFASFRAPMGDWSGLGTLPNGDLLLTLGARGLLRFGAPETVASR
jgi:hypothetical protein